MSSIASPARIAANKANAQRSTGPRTPDGKARVSENALKHGLRSERNPLDLASDTCLPAEREEFAATLAAFLDDLAPQGPLETRLVERLAQIDLRLNRAIRMETTHLDMHIGLLTGSMAGALPPDEQTQHAWLTTLAFLKNPSATALIAQYESRLHRDFARTLTQLRQAQAMRAKADARNIGNQTQAQPLPTHPLTRVSASSETATSPQGTPATPIPQPSPIPEPQEKSKQTQPTPQPHASERHTPRQPHAIAA